MYKEIQWLVTDGPVKVEKLPIEVLDVTQTTNHLRVFFCFFVLFCLRQKAKRADGNAIKTLFGRF